MRGNSRLVVLGGLAATVVLAALSGPILAADEDPGKAAFLANKCNMCHGVSSADITATTKSEKMKGPDLKGKVAEVGVDWARKFIKKEVDKDGKKHSKEYKGTAEDLDKILTWLEGQK
jgi:hypothetical protein